MPVFERNLIALEDFYLSAGGAIEFYLPDVRTDLHSIGAGVHAQRAAYRPRYADEPFHAAEVILRAEGYRAAEVRRRVHLGKGAIDDDFGLGLSQLEHDPRQFAVSHQQVGATAQEPVRDAVGVEQIQQIRNAFVLLDAKEIGGAAYSERSEVGERGTAA